MHLTSPSHRHDDHSNSAEQLMTLGWEQGSFALNQLIEGCFDLSLGSETPLPSRNKLPEHYGAAIPISPVGINLHMSSESTRINAQDLLDLLLAELDLSLMYWKRRPLGDLYWNRHLIEHLDEGSLTELAFNLASKLKQPPHNSHHNYQHSYQHIAELSITEDSLRKMALLRGLGVTKIVFSLPLLCGPNPQLITHLLAACKQARDLDYIDICIRLTYDFSKVGAKELLSLFLDLPLLGEHELCLNPVYQSGETFISLWEHQAALDTSGDLFYRIRKWLISQGYKALSFDCFILRNRPQFTKPEPRNKPVYPEPRYFTPMGQLKASSPDFIGIGPGALSRLGMHIAVNQNELEVYSSQLSQGDYPRQSCKKLNAYFLSIEHQLIHFLQSLSIDLNQIEASLGKEHMQKVQTRIEKLPSEQWNIDSMKNLTLESEARDWLPLICSWLIHRQPAQKNM